MTQPLTFDAITVHRMYGARFKHLRADGFCGGINVIHGPNATGKTTLVRALRTVLWPDHEHNGACELIGRFSLDGASWRVNVDGSGPRYQRDGQRADAPGLPPADHHARYYLHLQDLLRITEDEDFAQAILRDAVGGFDVEKAADARGFKEVRPQWGKTSRALEEAESQLEKVRREQDQVRRQQRELEDLEGELEEAQRAQRRSELLDRAVKHAERREQHREAQALLESFSPLLEQVQGDEIERLEALRQQWEEARRLKDDAEGRVEEAIGELEASPLPEAGLPEGLIPRLAGQAEQLRNAEQELAQHRKDLAACQKERTEAARLLGGVDEDALATLDLSEVRDISVQLRRAETVRAKQTALKQLMLLLEEDDAEDADYHEAARLLQRWLRASRSADRAVSPLARYGTLAAALLLIGSAVVGAALGVPAALALLAVAALLLVVYLQLPKENQQPAETEVHEREYRRLDVEPPVRWEEEAVDVRLTELFEAQADRILRQRAAAKRKEAAREERDVADELADVQEERRRAAQALGLDPEALEEELVLFVEALARWQDAHARVMGLEEKVQLGDEEVETCRAGISELLAPYGFESVSDASDAHASIEELREAQRAWQEARRDRMQATEEAERASKTASEVEADIETLFATFELEADDDGSLRALVRQRPDYEKALDAARQAETACEVERERMQEHELYEAGLEDVSAETLERDLDDVRESAAEAEDLAERIAQVRERVRGLRAQHDLERARAECEARLEALRREREHDYRRTAGWRLAEFVRQETQDHDLPDVFARAQHHFNVITAGAYELRFDKEHGRFTAYETATHRGLELGMLSSGTRVQLLLAVRIAFIENQEQHYRLPLVLDETLANSDDTRARAIIEGVFRLCRDGRQIFYFTAQDDEVAKWHALARTHNDVEAHFIELTGDEGPDEVDVDALPAAFVVDRIPSPEGHDHAAFGALLDVPAWDAYGRSGELHLWYLIEDPELLHRLLRRGVSRWGPLHNLVTRGTVTALGINTEELAPVCVAGKAVEAWQRAWREGRGRRVDRAALEETDAVSDRFLEDVCDLAQRVGGDGRAIIEALHASKVKGFYRSKTEELEAYFQTKDYIDVNEPLSSEEIWTQVLADVQGEMTAGGVDTVALRRVLDRIRTGPPQRGNVSAVNGHARDISVATGRAEVASES